MPNNRRLGIVLSGTAPTMTLMSGAMLAFAHHKVEFDVISTTGVSELWTDPESIQEALELAIMDPIVTLAEDVAALYALQDRVFNQMQDTYPKIYRLPFEIPEWQLGKILEWSYSNALTLWDVGHRAAIKFCDDMVAGRPPEANRYFSTLVEDSREGDFLKLFGDAFSSSGNVKVPLPKRSRRGGGL